MSIYAKGEILSNRIGKYAKVEDLLSCRDELFIQQSNLEDNTSLYADALDSQDTGKTLLYGEVAAKKAQEIINSKEKMAKIQNFTSSHITRETLFMLVRNIADMLYDTFAVDELSTEKVAELVATIEASVLGTTTNEVSEHELFAEMIETVPLLECECDD